MIKASAVSSARAAPPPAASKTAPNNAAAHLILIADTLPSETVILRRIRALKRIDVAIGHAVMPIV
jgi:hypothetical protein